MADTTKTVKSKSEAVERMHPAFDLAEALLGGTAKMRAEGEKYLPRWPNEDKADWQIRLARSVLFPAYKRTVETLAAKPFSRAVTIGDDVPADVKDMLADIDLEGRNLDTFAAECLQHALGYGLGGILVDVPPAPPETRTQAQERAAGIRPYWVHIKAEQILGWRAEKVGGAWKLAQLRIEEEVEEPDGDWGTKCVEQVRVLEPGKWTTYREQKRGDGTTEWVQHETGANTVGGAPIDFVPFAPYYGERCGFMMGRPPLMEVAHLNVAHWQSASDQQNILHVARVPILTVTGAPEMVQGPGGEMVPWKFTVGASAAVKLPQGADMKFVEHTGAAISAGASDLKDLEDRMRQAGAELLVLGPGATTRIEAAGDNEVATCALQRITLAMQDTIGLALEYTARWMGKGENAGGGVKLYTDFGALTLGEAMSQLIADMTAAGIISQETAFEELQRRGVIDGSRTWQDEQERKDAQGPALGTMGGGSSGGAGGTGATA